MCQTKLSQIISSTGNIDCNSGDFATTVTGHIRVYSQAVYDRINLIS